MPNLNPLTEPELQQAYKNLVEWLLIRHESIFIEADISKTNKVNILQDLNYSTQILNTE